MNVEPPRAPKKPWVLFAAAAAAAVAAVLAWQAIASGPLADVADLLPQVGAEPVEAELTELQRTYPLESAPGVPVDLRALPQDTLIFLNFWATWCPPCRDELPSMLELSASLAGRRFTMIAVSYDDDWDAISAFFARFPGGPPAKERLTLWRDPVPTGGVPLRELFGTSLLPDSYLILNGVVLARFVNARDWMTPAMVQLFERLAPAR